MSTKARFLVIEPLDLRFHFELNRQISCSLRVSNKTDDFVAFKVKTTNPKNYCVRPNSGVVLPRSSCEVTVTMQAQKEAPPDMECKDKFLIQSIVVDVGCTAKDITAAMFSKDSGNVMQECKLRVVYVLPPQSPSTDHEEAEDSLLGTIASENYGTSESSNLGSVTSVGSRGHLSAGLSQKEVPKQRYRQPLVLVTIIAMLAVLLSYFVKK